MMFRYLVVFDFDHTIIDDNSDTAIIDLVGKSNIPPDIRELQHRDGWTEFMQGVFTIAYKRSIDEEMIKEHVMKLPPVEGLPKLITELHRLEKYDMIIISDSNTLFINLFLEKHGLHKCFTRVFSNPAEFENGHLKIRPYHHQESCKLSTKNLCKGQILEDFLAEQKQNEITYDRVIYIGDGVNDFCPILRLNSNDLACVRNKHKLHDIVVKAREGKSLDNSGQPHVLKAEVIIWDTGDDILKKIKK